MSLGDCWFCGEPSRSGDHVRTGLRRDAEESLLGMRRERKATWIDVPRCRRCRIGHEVDRAISYVLIGSAAITGLALLAWGASRLSGDAWPASGSCSSR